MVDDDPDDITPRMTQAVLERDYERTDRGRGGLGFRAWLVQVDPKKGGAASDGARPAVDFCIEHFYELPMTYEFDVVAEMMRKELLPKRGRPTEEQEDALDDMLRSLAVAEAEWRSESLVKRNLIDSGVMGIARAHGENVLSWRNPQVDDVCGFRSRGGMKCRSPAVPGTPRCSKHGGALVDAEVRRAYLMTAYAAVVEASEDAVRTLVEVATSGRNELARVAAAKEILDRAGMSPSLNVNVNLGGAPSRPLVELREKLDRIQKNLRAHVIDVESTEVDTPTVPTE